MKNLRYFPFERNKYYYGKLLSERDFVDEQRYINDKRRLINRMLHGVGIVAGLQVLAVDDWNLSVEAGLALDFSGREILVDTPVIRRLSTLDGFDALVEQGKKRYIYLCIEYNEEEAVPAHSVMGGSGGQRTDYEKYKEGYRLYLTDQEPDSSVLTRQNLVRQTQEIYRDGNLRITQTFPRFVESGKEFKVSITVENMGPGVQIAGNIKEALSCADMDGKQMMEAVFEDTLLDSGSSVTKTFTLKSAAVSRGQAELRLDASAFRMKTDRGALELLEERVFSVPMIQGNAGEELGRIYYKNLMEDAIRDNYPQGVYLARIQLIHHEKTYLIDGVQALGFDQYICSSQLLKNRLELLEIGCTGRGERVVYAGSPADRENKTDGEPLVKTGRVEISLGIGAKRGQRFFSHEIFHGLGLGPVNIQLSLEEDQMLYCGSSEVFEGTEVRAELAAKADMDKGAFTVGVRMLEPSGRQKVVVCWRAELMAERTDASSDRKQLYIRPERLEMKVRETAWLEAVCPGVPGATALWSVKTPEGGSITQDGMYTSPNVPGVYEVSACCQEIPELKSSIYIIVRE